MTKGGREAAVRDITRRYLLLTSEGEFLTPQQAEPIARTASQRRMLGLPTEPAGGYGRELDGAMLDLRLGSSERRSDKGHFRYFPAGALVRKLLTEWTEAYVRGATGGAEITTPTVFRWNDGDYRELVELAGTFEDFLYHIGADADARSAHILRYGGDPGFFAMMQDVSLARSSFPFHVYELTQSFRKHRSGEVAGILRARSFTFFDHHALCLDRSQALAEFARMLYEQKKFLETTGRRYDLELITVESELPRLADALPEIARNLGVDAYLTVLSRAKHYYTLVSNFCDARGKHIFQIQFDEQNARRFRLAGCPQRYPDMVVLHMSAGALERWMASFLQDGLESGRRATLPVWLSPVQVRVLPYRAEHHERAHQVRSRLEDAGLRVDLDDRSRSLGHRLAAAEREWVPFVAVLGGREVAASGLDVLDRATGRRTVMTEPEIRQHVLEMTAGYPRHALVEPAVAGRPQYGG